MYFFYIKGGGQGTKKKKTLVATPNTLIKRDVYRLNPINNRTPILRPIATCDITSYIDQQA